MAFETLSLPIVIQFLYQSSGLLYAIFQNPKKIIFRILALDKSLNRKKK